MKNTKNSTAKKNSTIEAKNHCASPAQYAMRDECQPDCAAVEV